MVNDPLKEAVNILSGEPRISTADHIAQLELRIYSLECCDTVNAYQEACRLRRKVSELKAASTCNATAMG